MPSARHNKKINILFPIETTSRELDFRLVLAALCIGPEKRVFIGHYPVIDRMAGHSVSGGLYVGKNILEHGFRTVTGQRNRDSGFFSSDLSLYHSLKRNGFTLIHLHEEGAIYQGEEGNWKSILRRQLNPTKLAAEDHICTWGEFQREYYRSLDPACIEHIHATGHPRFDLYKDQYKEIYRDEVTRLEAQYGPFVLINTSFTIANSQMGNKDLLFRSLGLNPGNDADRMHWIGIWTATHTVMGHFVRLIHRLSIVFKDLNFVVRPHPSEDPRFYEDLFHDVKNIHVVREGEVSPWLIACKALIHHGCTTSIEAALAGKVAINYNPHAEKGHSSFLSEQFSVNCRDESEVIERLTSVGGPSDTPRAPFHGVSEQAYSLMENFRQDSFEKLIGVIEEAGRISCRDKPSPLFKLRLTELVRHAVVSIALFGFALVPERFDIPYSRSMQRYVKSKFPGFKRRQIYRKLANIEKVTGKRVSCSILSPQLLVIEAG